MSYNVLYLTKHSKPRNARTPSPVHIQKSVKHSPIRPKSAHPHPVINAKNQVIRRPATAKVISINFYFNLRVFFNF